MGLFSKIFGGKKSNGTVSGKNPGSAWTAANKFNRARGGFAGGYGAWTFGNIMDAHGGAERIIDEHGLDQEECKYKHPLFGVNCWQQAYMEARAEAEAEAQMLAAMGVEVDVEDLIDWEQVEADAYDYAEELAEMYINGDTWIPIDILNWAYYEVSDHNG